MHSGAVITSYLKQKSKLSIKQAYSWPNLTLKPAKQTVAKLATYRLLVSFCKIYFCKYYTNNFKIFNSLCGAMEPNRKPASWFDHSLYNNGSTTIAPLCKLNI